MCLLENMAFRSVFTTFSGTKVLAPCAQHPKRDPILSQLKPVHTLLQEHSFSSVSPLVLRKDLQLFLFFFI
jgi:hypothetical protein